jgi:hypothetical protein
VHGTIRIVITRRIIIRRGPSETIKELGRTIERQYGIQHLAAGERRPDGYYTPNHYTARGLRPIADAKAPRKEH